MSTSQEIELEILNLCESEQNFNDYYPQIEEHILTKDKALIQEIVNVAASALDTNSKPPMTNFLLLLLIQKAIVKRSSEMVNEAHQSQPFLKAIEKIARHDKNNKDPNRGKTLYPRDPKVGQQMLILVLEFIAKMAKSFPADSQKKPTKFNQLYTRLADDGVTFPKEPYVFFAQKKKKQQSGADEKEQQQQQQSSKTPGAGQTKTGGKFNPTAVCKQPIIYKKNHKTQNIYEKIMEDIKQSICLMLDSLSKTDDFDENLETELVNQTQRFTKHGKTLSEIIQQESELPEELMHKIFQYIELITSFCDHSQEVIGEGYLKESTLKFKNWLFSSELPFSIDDEESQSIKKPLPVENDKASSKNEKQPSDHFDFNSFPAQQQQQSQQPTNFQSQYAHDGEDDVFSAFSKSQVNKQEQLEQQPPQQQQGNYFYQQSDLSAEKSNFQPEKKNESSNNANVAGSKLDNMTNKNPRRMPNILEDEENDDSVEMHRRQQAELDSQMKGLRLQQLEDEKSRKQQQLESDIAKQLEDEDKLRRQNDENERIKRQIEEERIKKLKEAEDRQKKQKEDDDRLRKQAEDQQNLLRNQRDDDERKRARIQQDAEEAEKMRLQLLKEQQEQDRLFQEDYRLKAKQLINQNQVNNQQSYYDEDDQKNRFSFNGSKDPKDQGYFYTQKDAMKSELTTIAEEERGISNPQSKFVNSKLSKIERAFGEAPPEKFSVKQSKIITKS